MTFWLPIVHHVLLAMSMPFNLHGLEQDSAVTVKPIKIIHLSSKATAHLH